MLGYIKKFVLDSFPSIIATIIGAYIVHHYVIPAAAPKAPANAVMSEPAPSESLFPGAPEKASFEKGVAEKSAIEKAAEKASDKSAETSTESKRRHVVPRVANRSGAAGPEATGSVDTATTDERRNANELARAAIERLRNAPAPPKTVALAPATSTHNVDEAARVVAPMQPLPPAVAVPKSPDVFDGGADAATRSLIQHPDFLRTTGVSKPTPPAEIPEASPIELHAEAQAAAQPSITEGVVSAAKSVFHAVVPR